MLDTMRGCGAANMRVDVRRDEVQLASVILDEGGRGRLLAEVVEGAYELLFHVKDYQGADFFDVIPVRFRVMDTSAKYHIPLILSPYGYSTYRGG